MRKSIFIILLAAITLIALTTVRLWALGPVLTPLNSISSTEFTGADIVRRVWHLRLVTPEWASNLTDYVRWSQAESLTRSIVVALGWLVGFAFIVRARSPNRRTTSPVTMSQPIIAH
jgi:hypothetical protein